MKKGLFAAVFLSAALAAGCAMMPSGGSSMDDGAESSAIAAFAPIEHGSDWYKKAFDASDSAHRQDLAILVARAYIKENNPGKAELWIKYASEHALTPLQSSRANLVRAQLLENKADYASALRILQEISPEPLSNMESANYYALQGAAQRHLGQWQSAFKSHVILNQFIANDYSALKKNQEAIMSILLTQNADALEQVKSRSEDETEIGYLELALIHSYGQGAALVSMERDWLLKYPDHPAKSIIDANKSRGADADPLNADMSGNTVKVAVMMPFSGKLAPYGNAFRHGIMMAQRNLGYAGSIRYYDVTGLDARAVYERAVADGAGIVIGPLTKQNVGLVVAGGANVPTLAMNDFNSDMSYHNVFFFALSPENEGAQAAIKMRYDGINAPVLLVPATEKGSRIINGFTKSWLEAGGNDPQVLRFRNKKDVTEAISNAFANGDHDGVYICGSAIETALIKGKIEADHPGQRDYYITSNSNPGSMRASVVKKMGGMHLGDMPWLLEDSDMKAQIEASIDESDINTLTFFALGYDALSIAPELSQLEQTGAPREGLSGYLGVDPSGRVTVRAKWITIPDAYR